MLYPFKKQKEKLYYSFFFLSSTEPSSILSSWLIILSSLFSDGNNSTPGTGYLKYYGYAATTPKIGGFTTS